MRGSTPIFAGRHAERRILEHGFDEACGHKGGAVIIEGLAGTGKSRLMEYAQATAARRGFTVLAGVGAEGQESTPYGLLLDAFRSHVRSRAGDRPAWLDARSPWTDLILFRPAPALQGPPHAFHEICRALTQHGGPLLLALEDLHWADRSSLEIVEWLLRDLGARQLLLVATFRREGLTGDADRADRIHRLLRHPRVRSLPLAGLSLVDTRELIDATLPPGDHGFLARQLQRRTQGNPLFLEELLRSIVRDGTSGADTALPASFRDAVRSRLRGLAREDLRLLQLAAVIGGWFDLGTIAYLTRRTESNVRTALARLRDEHLLRESRDGRRFGFWHALTRDAFYEQLLLPDRRALHRRLAQRWIANLKQAEAEPSAIAYQLEKAGEEQDAARYYAAAAEQAAGIGAFDEAFAQSERAFAFSIDGRRARALSASRYARMAGHVGPALAYCQRARDAAGENQDPLECAELLLHQSDLYWLNGDGNRAAELLAEIAGLRAAHRATDASAWAWWLARTAHRACLESRWADVLEPAADAIAMSRRLGLPLIEAHALITRSLAEGMIHGVEGGLASVQRGRALAGRHASVEDVCRSYVVEADLQIWQGDFAAVCQTALIGAEHARSLGAPVVLYPELAVTAVEFLWKTGRWQEALDRVPETERLVNEQPSGLVRCHLGAVLAGISIARGHLDEAEGFVADALDSTRKMQEAQWVLPAYVTAAELALAAGKPDEAIRRVEEALRRFSRSDPSETAELRTLGLEALCRLAETGRCTERSTAEFRTESRHEGGRFANYHAKMAGGFASVLAMDTTSAVREFRAAAGVAVALHGILAEARARRWLATSLRMHTDPGARQEAVREHARAAGLLAAIPGRRAGAGAALEILSPREREVAHLVAAGLANKDVGARLSISDRTVAVHVGRIFEKVGVNSRHRLTALMSGRP